MSERATTASATVEASSTSPAAHSGHRRSRRRHPRRKSSYSALSLHRMPPESIAAVIDVAVEKLLEAAPRDVPIAKLGDTVRIEFRDVVLPGKYPGESFPPRGYPQHKGREGSDEDDEDDSDEDEAGDDATETQNKTEKPHRSMAFRKDWKMVCALTEKSNLRKILAEQILPRRVTYQGQEKIVEIDVIEAHHIRYPWLARLVKSSQEVFDALREIPTSCGLQYPDKLTAEFVGNGIATDGLQTLLDERRRLVTQRRSGKLEKDAKLEDLMDEIRKLGVQTVEPTDQPQYEVTHNRAPPDELPEEVLDAIAPASVSLLAAHTLSPKFKAVRERFLEKLQRIITHTYCSGKQSSPPLIAHLFGSSVTGLGLEHSDVDVTFEILDPTGAHPDTHPISNMYALADTLRANGMTNVHPVARARVPIVKFHDPVHRLSCDVNVGNMLGIANSKLISEYLRCDARLRDLIMLVKRWARARELNDPASGGTISSYSYVLMCVHYMQLHEGLVNLQARYEGPRRVVVTRATDRFGGNGGGHARRMKVQRMKDGAAAAPLADDVEPPKMVSWDVSFATLEESGFEPLWTREDGDEVAHAREVMRLFHGFMRHYGWVHAYRHDQIVSVRCGRVLTEVPEILSRVAAQRPPFVIEDPFQLDRNTTGMVEDHRPIVKEFRRAVNLLATCDTVSAASVLEEIFALVERRLREVDGIGQRKGIRQRVQERKKVAATVAVAADAAIVEQRSSVKSEDGRVEATLMEKRDVTAAVSKEVSKARIEAKMVDVMTVIEKREEVSTESGQRIQVVIKKTSRVF